MSEEELEKMMEERYRPGSGFVKYAEDAYGSKRPMEVDAIIPSSRDPTIWKIKCMVWCRKINMGYVSTSSHSSFIFLSNFFCVGWT